MGKINTFIITVTFTGNIERCLETLYRYTKPGTFYVYLIDQTSRGLDANKLRDTYPNLMYIRSPKTDHHYTGNLGFSLANNLLIQMVRTPFFTLLNDDVEFINKRWWYQIMKVFDRNPMNIMVSPASIRFFDKDKNGNYLELMPYKENYTEEDYDWLVETHHKLGHLEFDKNTESLVVQPWCAVTKTAEFKQVGMFDEKFYPSGGEDYDWNARCHTLGFRAVSCCAAWTWHWCSSSRNAVLAETEEAKKLVIPERKWNNLEEKWGTNFSVYGIKELPMAETNVVEL